MADDWLATLDALVGDILPLGPEGARALAHTRQAVRASAAGPELAPLVQAGCRALDAAALQSSGQRFAVASDAARHALLVQLARGSPPAGWDREAPNPTVFWTTVRVLAAGHCYGSPLGWTLCGFPGPALDRGGYAHTVVESDPLRPTAHP